jgi:HEAT repeat protein
MMRKSLAVLAAGMLLVPGCRSREPRSNISALLVDLQSTDSQKSGRANLELIRIGELAVPGLLELFRSPDPRVRNLAASAFWGMGPKGRAAVPTLAESLTDPRPCPIPTGPSARPRSRPWGASDPTPSRRSRC